MTVPVSAPSNWNALIFLPFITWSGLRNSNTFPFHPFPLPSGVVGVGTAMRTISQFLINFLFFWYFLNKINADIDGVVFLNQNIIRDFLDITWDIYFDKIDEVLPLADFLYLAVPETEETKGLINKERLDKLKKTCDAIDGDIAGFGEDWIVVTPSFAEVHRHSPTPPQPQNPIHDSTSELEKF